MNYEKLYRETIDKLRKLHNDWNSTQNHAAKEIESVFPELRESEDKKWRNWLINHLKGYINQTNDNYAEVCKEAISWLEKQAEQKPVEWDYPYGENETVDKLMAIAECLEMDGDCEFNGYTGTECGKFLRDLARKEVECEPSWSEDDEQNLNFWLNNNKSIDSDKRNWLRTLKDRVQPKPKQEWSEEDERMIETIIYDLERHGGKEDSSYSAEINWLKVIKERYTRNTSETKNKTKNKCPNYSEGYGCSISPLKQCDTCSDYKLYNHWKPSEQNIKDLEWCADLVKDKMGVGFHRLQVFIDEIKKL